MKTTPHRMILIKEIEARVRKMRRKEEEEPKMSVSNQEMQQNYKMWQAS